MKFNFINVEFVDKTSTYIFKDVLIPTYELTQSTNEGYLYEIGGFVIKPSQDYTSLKIVELPNNNYKFLTIIAGLYRK